MKSINYSKNVRWEINKYVCVCVYVHVYEVKMFESHFYTSHFKVLAAFSGYLKLPVRGKAVIYSESSIHQSCHTVVGREGAGGRGEGYEGKIFPNIFPNSS